jgi:prepilin-type processing-associated H-X9-DG protein
MNAFVGNKGDGGSINYQYRQYLKLGDFNNPVGIFVLLDEHPDSINDGWFVFCTAADPAEEATWSDLPASYHGGACGFSFADGHSEIKKWVSGTTIHGVVRNSSYFPVPVGNDKRDIRWVSLKTTAKK